MLRKFATRFALVLVVIIGLAACDINTPHQTNNTKTKNPIEALIYLFHALQSLGKESAGPAKVYHTTLDCPAIRYNSEGAGEYKGTSPAADAEKNGYTRCPFCCEHWDADSLY